MQPRRPPLQVLLYYSSADVSASEWVHVQHAEVGRVDQFAGKPLRDQNGWQDPSIGGDQASRAGFEISTRLLRKFWAHAGIDQVFIINGSSHQTS